MYQIENVSQLPYFCFWLQMSNMSFMNNANPQPLQISSHNSLKPHQSKENYTKRHNLATLLMPCTLEPKFLKIGATFLAQSNKPLYLLPTTEFSLFENSRNLPLLKKWVTSLVMCIIHQCTMCIIHYYILLYTIKYTSLFLIICLALTSNFQKKPNRQHQTGKQKRETSF